MIDSRIIDWIESGCPGARELCLHIPSFMVIEAIQRNKEGYFDLQSVIAFLISDLVTQVKDGDKAHPEEIKVVWDSLTGMMPDPSYLRAKRDIKKEAVEDPNAKPSILDLPVRKRNGDKN